MGIAASLLLFFLFYNFKAVRSFLSSTVSILMPFIVGAVIAYLLSPLYNMLLRNLDDLFQVRMNPRKARGLAVGVSITLSILFGLVVLGGIIALVLPRFITSVIGVASALPTYAEQGNQWLERFFASNSTYAAAAQETYNALLDYLEQWTTSDLLPNLRNLSNTLGGINSLVSNLVNGVVYAFRILKNTLLGFIVAAYFLASKTKLISQMKQLMYSLFSVKVANAVILKFRYIHKVFGGFIRGKLLDSLIIGLLCFFGTSLLGIPFSVLISVVVGVTNIIPFFGPFIGAIPSALIILMTDPFAVIPFLIFILVLQQFDGNILGPKILGSATGVSSFWVLFSILFFGGLWGIVGMIIGIPTFAVIARLLERFISNRLEKRGCRTELEAYDCLSHVEVGPDGKPVYYYSGGGTGAGSGTGTAGLAAAETRAIPGTEGLPDPETKRIGESGTAASAKDDSRK